MMTANEVRESFKKFFEGKGHKIVPSAPMVIKDDPTLMFTNAGMNQWKDIILGTKDPGKDVRRVDTQKCLRVSGKHNDLEEVGHDTYHHTMFEMLGNWSFGDYFKEGAIDLAWEYLTEVLKLNPADLYVTVFEGSKEEGLERDNEAAGYWAKHVPADHIINGNKHDNFWEMGDTGPCGPCSEIHVDSRTPEEKAQVPGRELVNKDNPQVIEIWNIVFMQYNRKADGSLEPLPMHVIDTGMGFERLVRAMQGKHSNYDTDIFQPIIKEEEAITGMKYGEKEETDVAMRVCADHLRAVAFSIADGQLPSNAKAGYVIRRILRRAVRYAYTFLGQKDGFLYKLIPVLTREMGEAFPELKAQHDLILHVIKEEEDSFLRTLEKGINMLNSAMDELKKQGKTELDGVQAFRLFDTYGFPLDLTELICRENGFTVAADEFDAEMQKQKERARNAAAVENSDWVILREGEQQFVGYDFTEYECHILRYRKVTQKKNTYFELVLDNTPFYGEMGGQVGDTGVLVSEDETVTITDTKRENGQSVHIVKALPKNPEADFMACVDVDAREGSAANHTATHLLDYALKQVLGDHVEQKGSFVSPTTLRFDFSHFTKVTDDELRKVERLVNDLIRQDLPLDEHRDTPFEEAKKLGAIALFGEKYGDRCAKCHRAEAEQWARSGHGKSASEFLQDESHNAAWKPADHCLRCHGMFLEGEMSDIVKRKDLASRRAIPCTACHRIHSEDPLQLFSRGEWTSFPAANLHLQRIFTPGGREVRRSPDAQNRLCANCHAANAEGVAGSSDDRTPLGGQEGMSCTDCHKGHDMKADPSRGRCPHPQSASRRKRKEGRSMTSAAFVPMGR